MQFIWYLAKLVITKTIHWNVRGIQEFIIVKQESFHAHFADGLHSGEGGWEVRLIDQSDSTEDQQHEFDTFQSNGLNERKVALF